MKKKRNTKGLKRGKTFEKDHELASRAAKKAAEVKRQKKTFRECFEDLLCGEHDFETDGRMEKLTASQIIALKQVEKAMCGDIKAAEFIRDTIGEKPTDKVQISTISQDDINSVESEIAALKEVRDCDKERSN